MIRPGNFSWIHALSVLTLVTLSLALVGVLARFLSEAAAGEVAVEAPPAAASHRGLLPSAQDPGDE